MRIAYCIHSLHNSGGMERVLTIKANALSALPECEVHIIAYGLKGRKPYFPLEPAVVLHDLGINERIRPFTFRRKLSETLKDIRPEVTIGLSGAELSFLPDIDDGSAKIAEFHFSHEKFFLKYGRSPLGRTYAAWRTRRLENMASRLDRFVVLTKEDKESWIGAVPQTVQIYNPLTFVSEQKASLEEKRCIAVGRLVYQKNFSDLIKAWAIVAKECPDWKLDIFGDGPFRKSLAAEISAAGLEGTVRLMGRTSNVCEEMLASSCLAMSSRYEGFPMTLLEAAETGLPMVSYSCPKGPSEIIQDGVNGYLLTPGDVDALAERIISIIKDTERRKEMGWQVSLSAKAFTLDKIISQWMSLFAELSRGKSGN
ncbi:MAG: glycosyltransferase family 4 protein [Bacteroidales bacterium]|nr:glycosyltransferase family 4 protein [Bacteroidales bacterium]